MHQPPEDRGDFRRRRLFLAAAASDRAAWDARLGSLVSGYPVEVDPAHHDRLQPTAEFWGYRDSRAVASISSRPASREAAIEQFRLVCRTLAALKVDAAALVAGDEWALLVSASADHPSDLAPFVIGLTFGPAGVKPGGRIVPYEFDRHRRAVTWKEPRQVRASSTRGLWAEVLGPMCLTRGAAGDATLAELLDQNRQRGHLVLQL